MADLRRQAAEAPIGQQTQRVDLLASDLEARAALAANLINLGNQLSDQGRHGEALAPTEEGGAGHLPLGRGDLAPAGEDAALHRTGLADALGNPSDLLLTDGQRQEALDPALEAEQILRELTKGKTELREEHANALLQVVTVRRELGQGPQSLAPNQEAVALLREVAIALNNLGLAYGNSGRRQEALAPTQEAVSLDRELVKTQKAHRAKLSSSLSNLGKAHGELGQLREALPPLVETVGLLRALVKDSPAHRGELGRALDNLGYLRLVMGQKDQARALLEESLGLVRPLAASNPYYQGDLRRTMANLEHLKR
jgi:tetratricopeptide (TPR) repeat protein